MDPHAGRIVINGATSQDDRWLNALDPAYAPVDGRGFTELLDFAVRFGALIRYYDGANQPDGDWVAFFLSDPTMVLAAIVSLDAAALRAEYERLQAETARTRPYERKFELLRETFGCVLALARLVNGWMRALDQCPPGQGDSGAHARILEAIDEELRDALLRLKAYDQGAASPEALNHAIGLDYEGFLPIWQLGFVCPDSSIYKGATRPRRINHALPHLDPLFYAFFDFIGDLQSFAAAALATTPPSGDHNPSIALYMAFVRLFANAQDTLNTFSSRYADFYDRRVLREPNAGPLPDSVYLTFTLAAGEGVHSAPVPGGTLFTAGQDSAGNEILYAADRDLTVTSATIAKLRTLYVAEEPFFGGGESPIPQFVRTMEIPLDGNAPWPTFGDAVSGSAATFGFALASPVLGLNDGDRAVEIRIGYQDPELAARLEKLAQSTGLEPVTIFTTILDNAFQLVASTPGGWFPIASYRAHVADGASFVLCFPLPTAAPPLSAFGAVGDGVVSTFTNPAPALPVVEAWLRQESIELSGPLGDVRVFPLSLLASIEVVAFDLHAEVRGLADMTLENTDGAIDSSQPFPLFGAVPVAGSYLRIRSTELFTKTPDSLSLNVTWFNLPPNANGFKGYYRDYVIGLSGKPERALFDNRVFRGDVGVLNPGAWNLADDSHSSPPAGGVYLFRTREDCLRPEPAPAGTLCMESRFDKLAVVAHEPTPYYDPVASAVVLELAEPPYAFGDVLYSQNVLNAVIADLPNVGLCQEQCLSECAPFNIAANCIGDCLTNCEGVSHPNVCLTRCLEQCADGLLAAAFARLQRCTEDCGGGPSLPALRDLAATCTNLPAEERGESLRTLLDVCRQLGGTGNACVEACTEKCKRLFSASESLYRSLFHSPSADLAQRARNCRKELEDEYKSCLETCTNLCLSLKKELKYPNAPYLPMAQAVRVDYTARGREPSFFRLLPFGGYEKVPALPASLLPPFPYEGILDLSFAGLQPPQVLTLLFRMAAGDDPAAERPPVGWQYLSGNAWTPLDAAQVLSDTTNGLQSSGVVTMALPSYDPAGGTDFNDGLQWLRAVVARDAAQFPRTAAIVPHAGTATWQSGGIENLGKPLPAGTISSSVQDLPSIAAIAQPMESFGGRAPEDLRAYQIRLGERLRHKDRAILGWDYERLVLERFPTVWRTQALPARNVLGGDVAGSVLVVIVPGPGTLDVVDPTTPKAPGEFLARIESDLEGLTSPFVQLRVVNPHYVRVQVTAVVQFDGAAESGGSIDRLNGDLVQYLSPWTSDTDRAADGRRYYTEDGISDFIQTRGYVASLIDIGFAYTPPPQSLEWYFVTSAQQHHIIENESPEPCP